MKIVLDTNVLISGIFWKGAPHAVIRAWSQNRFAVIASKDILDEYVTVLQRIDPGGTLVEQWTVFLAEHTQIVEGHTRVRLSRDHRDDMFINAAVSGGADYIVSGDDDLLSLGRESPVPILTPRAFAALLKKHL